MIKCKMHKLEISKTGYLEKRNEIGINSIISIIPFSRKLPFIYFFKKKEGEITVKTIRKCMIEKEVNGEIQRIYTNRFILRKGEPVTVYNTTIMCDIKIKFIWG